MMIMWVVAGWDIRYGWSSGIGPAAQIGALLIVIAGHALVVWATGMNAYFSQVVRIQTERGTYRRQQRTLSVCATSGVRGIDPGGAGRTHHAGFLVGADSRRYLARHSRSFGQRWKTKLCKPNCPATRSTQSTRAIA